MENSLLIVFRFNLTDVSIDLFSHMQFHSYVVFKICMKLVCFAAFALYAQPATCSDPETSPVPVEGDIPPSTPFAQRLPSNLILRRKASASDSVGHPVSPRTTKRPANAAELREVEEPTADGDSVPHDLDHYEHSLDSLASRTT